MYIREKLKMTFIAEMGVLNKRHWVRSTAAVHIGFFFALRVNPSSVFSLPILRRYRNVSLMSFVVFFSFAFSVPAVMLQLYVQISFCHTHTTCLASLISLSLSVLHTISSTESDPCAVFTSISSTTSTRPSAKGPSNRESSKKKEIDNTNLDKSVNALVHFFSVQNVHGILPKDNKKILANGGIKWEQHTGLTRRLWEAAS